jgi:hypothetical protein
MSPRRLDAGAEEPFPVLCVLVAIALLAGGSPLLAACGNTETGTINEFSAMSFSGEANYWIGVDLDNGEHVHASLTPEIADAEGISADMAESGTQKVEVGKKGDLWEFVRLVEE